MTLRAFQLEFERPHATYAPGEIVSGHVLIDLAREKSIRGLHVRAKGNAHVRWTESRSTRDSNGNTQFHTDTYSQTENYFTLNLTVLGQTDAGNITIPAGRHRYPFNFSLPINIPCSFEHQFGYIRYYIKAVMDRPWKFDHECKAAFTVIATLDLNAHFLECLAVEDETNESFCCFCCISTGSMKIRVRLPSSGYVPGQLIRAAVTFNNTAGNIEITRISARLQRHLKFHAHASKKSVVVDVVKTRVQGRFTAIDDVTCELRIPPVPPSRLDHCGMINMDYKLLVSIHVSGPHCKVKRSYPILIGTIPLRPEPSAPYAGGSTAPPTAPPLLDIIPSRDNNAYARPMPTADSDDPAPPYPYSDEKRTGGSPGASQPHPPIGFVRWDEPATSTAQWDMPPPSYEECTSGARHIRDHDDSQYVHGANLPFAPRYPMFDIPTRHVPKQ